MLNKLSNKIINLASKTYLYLLLLLGIKKTQICILMHFRYLNFPAGLLKQSTAANTPRRKTAAARITGARNP